MNFCCLSVLCISGASGHGHLKKKKKSIKITSSKRQGNKLDFPLLNACQGFTFKVQNVVLVKHIKYVPCV